MGSDVSQLFTSWINTRRNLITNQPELLDAMYAANAIIKRFIQMPVNDSMVHGYEIRTNELSEDEIKTLRRKMIREKDDEVIRQGVMWSRLWGGGGLLFITNGDYSRQFNEEEVVNSDLEIKAVDRWEITHGGLEEGYRYNDYGWDSFDRKQFSYYNETVDRSRLALIKGDEPTSRKKKQTGGWGLSVVEAIMESINTFIKSNNLVFEILDEFKVDIIKLNEMTSTLMSGGKDELVSRVRDIAMNKNFNSVLAIDGQDDFVTRNLNFSGLPEMMNQFRIHICGDLGIPITRFWGLSASGFSSGQEDITAYNVYLNSSVRPKILPLLTRVIELRCMQIFGYIPEDLEVEFNSMEVIPPMDEEAIKTQQLTRLQIALQDNIITPDQYKEAVNKAGLLPIDI